MTIHSYRRPSKRTQKTPNTRQNVNKVNTKATLRCPIDAPWIPLWAHEHLKKTVGSPLDVYCRHYAA